MKSLKEQNNYDEFLQEYSLFNEKSKYFKISKDGNISILAPSYILEIGYMYIVKKFKKAEKLWNVEDIVVKKYKKLKRHSCLDIDELEDKFFRTIINRDSVHVLGLGNELIRRDDKKFFDILYLNAKISNDNNRLIKLYLFEKIYKEIGLNDALLTNILRYFTTSQEGYGVKTSVDALYSYIYEKKFGEILDINCNKKNDINDIILEFLKGDE